MTNLKLMKIEFFAAIILLGLTSSVIAFSSASTLVHHPPNWSFEKGVLCMVPESWTMKTWNYTGSPPPISTYVHEVCENDTHYFSGNRSCYLHSRVVDTDGTVRDRYSWTWIEPTYWIYQPDATHVRFFIRDIQPAHSLFWGWNDEIWLGFNDSITVRQIHLYNNGESLNFNHFNDTRVGADGATWYEYIYPIPADINKSHMKVQIICIAGDWTFYSTSNFADMRFCVDDVEILYEAWPMFHHDPMHTGYSTSMAPNTGTILWKRTDLVWVTSSPAVADGRVYIGTELGDNAVYCLNATTGEKKWRYPTGGKVISSPAVFEGKVYVGSEDRNVYCLNATTGAVVWTYTTGGMVHSDPTVADGKVYVGSQDGKVYCLNATSGASIWSHATGGNIESSPAIAYNKVYATVYSGKTIYALNASNGEEIWHYATGNWMKSSPAIADGRVYAGSFDYNLYCFNATTGGIIWTYPTGDMVESSPAVASGRVYVGSYDNNLYCLNATTGAKIWNFATSNDVRASPAVADGKVYVNSYDGRIYALNATTGGKIWDYLIGGGSWASPAVAIDKVFIGTPGGMFYAFADIHDVAIANVVPDRTRVEQGSEVTIEVTTENQGNCTEDFYVTAYYDSSTIATQAVLSLAPKTIRTLAFTWNTGGVTLGTYTIKAVASRVSKETDIDDNTKTDGTVVITPRHGVGGFVTPIDKLGLLAPYIGLASTIIAATVAVIVYVKHAKRRKEKQ